MTGRHHPDRRVEYWQTRFSIGLKPEGQDTSLLPTVRLGEKVHEFIQERRAAGAWPEPVEEQPAELRARRRRWFLYGGKYPR